MTRRLTLLAAGLACVVSLAGCSDSSSPPASTESSAPTQTFAGPTMPGEAQDASRDGAQAFVGYWVETLNYATDSGDTEGLKTLATEDCENCAAFADTLDKIYGAGGHVETKGWELEGAVPEADRPETEPAFHLTLKLPPQKVFETADAKPKSYPGGAPPARIILTRQDDRWLVQSLDM